MQRLVEQFYPRTVQDRLFRIVSAECGIQPHRVLIDADARAATKRLRHQTLFMGLSDGARIDTIRHANAGLLGNEQFVQGTQVDTEKWRDLLENLRRDLNDDRDARFRLVYLVDDFAGTGTSFLRFDEETEKWKGKLIRFMESVESARKALDGDKLFEDNWVLCVHHYVASSHAAGAIREHLERLAGTGDFPEDWARETCPSFGTILPNDLPINAAVGDYDDFIKLTQTYYDPVIRTKHTDVGGVKHLGLGYGGCALPLVLEHNTPNNSVALLWAETDGGIRDGVPAPADAPALPPSPASHIGRYGMSNPFEKRATEYLRDDEAFLAVVTPEPVATFLQKPAKEGPLYDRLAMIIGTPGSGKTTLARLFQFTTLMTLLRNRSMANYKPLIDTLTACRAIEDEKPALIGGRLPLEAEYREFWELPYREELKTGLMTALLQARTVLAWLRNILASGVPLDRVEITPRADANAALSAIGGTKGSDLLARAREVEFAIYQISAALVPPNVEDIDREAGAAYRSFRRHRGVPNHRWRGTSTTPSPRHFRRRPQSPPHTAQGSQALAHKA